MEHAITFIHTADWHLGKPFAGIHDSAKRSRVQQERFESVRRIQQTVRERNAQFVVIAGDLFDSAYHLEILISSQEEKFKIFLDFLESQKYILPLCITVDSNLSNNSKIKYYHPIQFFQIIYLYHDFIQRNVFSDEIYDREVAKVNQVIKITKIKPKQDNKIKVADKKETTEIVHNNHHFITTAITTVGIPGAMSDYYGDISFSHVPVKLDTVTHFINAEVT